MKLRELKELTVAELEAKLSEQKKELFNLRFQQVTNQLENPMRIVTVKKTIARIKTLQKEAELKSSI